MSLADVTAAQHRAHVNAQSKPIEYTPNGSSPQQMRAFLRAPSAEELMGAALQTDTIAILDASQFFGLARPYPQKFDTVKTLGLVGFTYTVEEWSPRPAYGGEPVLYKLTLRGGQQ